MPHGETYDAWQRQADRDDLASPELVGRDFLGATRVVVPPSLCLLANASQGFMFHISAHVGLTKWAIEAHPDIRRELHPRCFLF